MHGTYDQVAVRGLVPASIGGRQGLDGELAREILRDVERSLDAVKKDPIAVLEAGGGSATFLQDFPRPLEFTTIDISPEQIERNTYAKEKILGDLEVYDYGERRFHLIICWDVLEHLAQPKRAMENMVAALAPNGVVLVKGPIPSSLKGLITRWTPHKVHVLYYRWVLGKKSAGKPGFAPFPTELWPEADPAVVETILRRHGFRIVTYRSFVTNQTRRLKERMPVLHALYKGVANVLSVLTGGGYGRFESDFCIVAQRGPA